VPQLPILAVLLEPHPGLRCCSPRQLIKVLLTEPYKFSFTGVFINFLGLAGRVVVPFMKDPPGGGAVPPLTSLPLQRACPPSVVCSFIGRTPGGVRFFGSFNAFVTGVPKLRRPAAFGVSELVVSINNSERFRSFGVSNSDYRSFQLRL